jgi:hypothetical protein
MSKDFKDTFQPYKGKYWSQRDIEQPVYGVNNIFFGLARIIATPLFFLWECFKIMSSASIAGSSFLDIVIFFPFAYAFYSVFSVVRSALRLLEGIAATVRGITQLATTPLTWLIKRPLRFNLTRSNGAPKIEETAGTIGLCSQANSNTKIFDLLSISNQLHLKYQKKIFRGQDSDIEAEETVFHRLENKKRSLGIETILHTSSSGDAQVHTFEFKNNISLSESKEVKRMVVDHINLFRPYIALLVTDTNVNEFVDPRSRPDSFRVSRSEI